MFSFSSIHRVSLRRTILFIRTVGESLPPGYPIREPAGHRMCAPLRSFSQLTAPFFAILLLRHPPWTYVSLDHIASAPGPHLRNGTGLPSSISGSTARSVLSPSLSFSFSRHVKYLACSSSLTAHFYGD